MARKLFGRALLVGGKFYDAFSRFDTLPKCDRHPDRQTDEQTDDILIFSVLLQ